MCSGELWWANSSPVTSPQLQQFHLVPSTAGPSHGPGESGTAAEGAGASGERCAARRAEAGTDSGAERGVEHGEA